MEEKPSPPPVWVVAVLLLGTALRLGRLDLHDYWVDEAISVYQATTPGLLESMKEDGAHTPLFVFLLSIWIRGGDSVAWVRLFPALCAILTMLVLVRAAWRHLGAGVGGAAVLIVASSSILVYYGQEVRPYPLVLLLSSVALGVVLDIGRAASPRWRDFVIYSVTGAILLYTHYFGAVFLGTCFLAGFAFEGVRRRRAAWTLVHMLTGLTFLPWLPFALSGFEKFRGIDMLGHLVSWWKDVAAPIAAFTIGTSIVPTPGTTLYPVELVAFYAGLLAGVVLGALGIRSMCKRRQWDTLVLLVGIVVLPTVLLVLATRLHLTQYNWSRFRYVIFSCPPLLVLYSIGLAALWGDRRYLAAIACGGALLSANLVSVANYLFNPQYLRAPAFREAMAFLGTERAAGEPIVCTHIWTYMPTWIGLDHPAPLYPLGETRERIGPSRFVAGPEDLGVPTGGTAWFVHYNDWRTRASGLSSAFPKAWDEESWPVTKQRRFRGLVVERRTRR